MAHFFCVSVLKVEENLKERENLFFRKSRSYSPPNPLETPYSYLLKCTGWFSVPTNPNTVFS